MVTPRGGVPLPDLIANAIVNAQWRLVQTCLAERQGFEPWVGVTYTRFPGVRLQPLGHLSVPDSRIIACPAAGWG